MPTSGFGSSPEGPIPQWDDTSAPKTPRKRTSKIAGVNPGGTTAKLHNLYVMIEVRREPRSVVISPDREGGFYHGRCQGSRDRVIRGSSTLPRSASTQGRLPVEASKLSTRVRLSMERELPDTGSKRDCSENPCPPSAFASLGNSRRRSTPPQADPWRRLRRAVFFPFPLFHKTSGEENIYCPSISIGKK
jgi:hypothetical protein